MKCEARRRFRASPGGYGMPHVGRCRRRSSALLIPAYKEVHMALIDRDVGVAVAATATVLSPRAREVARKGAVYGLAGVLKAGDVVFSTARGAARGAEQGVRTGSSNGSGSSSRSASSG